jgi:hypothetical protein
MCETGVLPEASAAIQLEGAAMWTGEPGKLYRALVQAGWVDLRQGLALLHDWETLNGAHIREGRRDRERKRRISGASGGNSGGDLPTVRTDGRTDVANGRTPDTTTTRFAALPQPPAVPVVTAMPLLRVAEHPAPADRPPRKAKPKKPPDPRHAPLLGKLVETFLQEKGSRYGFDGGKDAKAVQRLLHMEPSDAEILIRWKRALHTTHPRVDSLAEFASKFNAYCSTGKVNGDVSKGVAPPSEWGPGSDAAWVSMGKGRP